MFRVKAIHVPAHFKRFGSLEVGALTENCRLVVLVGPNGSGKSSIFEALLAWSKSAGKQQQGNVPIEYYSSDGTAGQAQVELWEQVQAPGRRVHIRTAYRNTPDVLTNRVSKVAPVDETVLTNRMIDDDKSLAAHYQRVVGLILPILSDLHGDGAEQSLQAARDVMTPVADSVQRLFPSLSYASLGNPTDGGSFFFNRDGERNFRFENLSGGEKSAFDLLLDAHVVRQTVGDVLYAVDEPEAHVNPAIQGALLEELLQVLGEGSQVWVATHSVGMMKKAFELAQSDPGSVNFLDLTEVTGPAPAVHLQPVDPSRSFVRRAMAVALDTLVDLQAPDHLVLCEGDASSDKNPAFDEHVYRRIFGQVELSTEFISCGGKAELGAAERLAMAISPGSTVRRLRDRDQLTAESRAQMLADDASLRILSKFSLESYLLEDDVLDALVQSRGGDAALLRQARDGAVSPDGSPKAALGAVYEEAKSSLENREQLGENKWQFARGVLAPLIVPGRPTFELLHTEVF